ncbi:unnamed protein product [Commensalibacter communis]|uniref:tetratricopeptide repeat protein n=1 Tax=Commensalibacter communis TaxID=2972786 RepID=UPI0022FF610C|nr:tetratricopeptide repeat protein [Commensalibacter communis]CAI3952325.1 unnamed protein product [Commensalibacter communis]
MVNKLMIVGCGIVLLMQSAFADYYVDQYLDTLKKEAEQGNKASQQKLDQINMLTVKANKGNVEAQYQLGMIYKHQGAFANEYLVKAAEQGDKTAQYEIGSFYIADEHNTADDSVCIDKKSVQDGLKWLNKSANQNYAPAQYQLSLALQEKEWAICYRSGTMMMDLGTYDLDKSKEWLLKAVAQQNMPAKVALGQWYLKGMNGYPKDINKALSLFKEAMDKGDATGYLSMAQCYQEGLGVPKDIKKAISLYQQAGDKGNYEALNLLSQIYSDQKQDKKASEYRKKSCDLRAKTHRRLWHC